MHILTEFIGDLAKLGPEFAERGVLGAHNIFNHCTRVPRETWALFADPGVNITVNPRSDALCGSAKARASGQPRECDGRFVAFLDIAYGFAGPAAGLIAGLFGYAAVYLLGAVSAVLGSALVVTSRTRES
jgi:5-methylthioadenosine/S-adenosylhomocysteine deaminase